jgi:hypothetical protein
VTLTRDPAGRPDALVLAEIGKGGDFVKPAWHGSPLVFPARTIAGLRAALAALESGQ